MQAPPKRREEKAAPPKRGNQHSTHYVSRPVEKLEKRIF